MNGGLLKALRSRANVRGLVMVREKVLLEALGIAGDALRKNLRKLEDEREVTVLSPLPHLVLRLRKWPARQAAAARMAPIPGPSAARAYSSQSSLSESPKLKESYRRPGADEALLREILDTLGETDPEPFRGAIRSYSPWVIQTALGRIRRMKFIRKSPTALFRYLLPRIANESHSPT